MNKDQPGIYSRSSSGESRGLLLAVVSGVVVMIFLIVALGALFLWEFWPNNRQEVSETGQLASANLMQPTVGQFSNPPEQTVATAEPTGQLEQETVSSAATEESTNNLLAKSIVPGSSMDRSTWTATPLPTHTPTPTPTPIPTFVSDHTYSGVLRPDTISVGEKWIDVNLTSQTLVAFEGSAPVFQSLVSSGTAKHPTVTGQFRIWLRFSAQNMDGRRLGYDYNLKDVPYVQYFYEDYALHGTYWHNNFGTPMSHGCVNLPTSSAEWVFNWADYGTLVNIHN